MSLCVSLPFVYIFCTSSKLETMLRFSFILSPTFVVKSIHRRICNITPFCITVSTVVCNTELHYGQIDCHIVQTVVKQALIAGGQDMPLTQASNIDHVTRGQGLRVGLHLQVFKRSCFILPFGQAS